MMALRQKLPQLSVYAPYLDFKYFAISSESQLTETHSCSSNSKNSRSEMPKISAPRPAPSLPFSYKCTTRLRNPSSMNSLNKVERPTFSRTLTASNLCRFRFDKRMATTLLFLASTIFFLNTKRLQCNTLIFSKHGYNGSLIIIRLKRALLKYKIIH